MKVLVIGGTRFFGVHMVKRLAESGHDVTLATRGITADGFGDGVKRLIVDRTSRESVEKTLGGKSYDAVCDNICLSSNEVKYLLDTVRTGRYVMTSTRSVYPVPEPPAKVFGDESGFDPLSHGLVWCDSNDFPYGEVKRQAEAAVYQVYGHIPAVTVRFPLVMGADDYTKRLYFYADHIVNGKPMRIENPDTELSFIKSDEAGHFIAWAAEQSFTGPVNAASSGGISVNEIIAYTEEKSGKRALYDDNGDPGTFNSSTPLKLDVSKAEAHGFMFGDMGGWVYGVLDGYVDLAQRSR